MQAKLRERPIAVFDSGLGGISVLRELTKQMPNEKFLYFGDSVNAPYGSRPLKEIREMTLMHAKRLLEESKALVIACNTATSAAAQELRQMYPDRIVVGIEPALKPAISHCAGGNIVVMATETTLRERKFEELMQLYAHDAHIIKCPCPELVAFVERGELRGQALEETIARRLRECSIEKIDAVVLGCTHFPFVKESVRQVIGEKPMIFDGADGTAKETRRRITEAGLAWQGEGSVKLTNSLQTDEIISLSEKLLHVI